MLKLLFSRRNLLVFGACYSIFWILTATLGVHQIRKQVIKGWQVPSDCVEAAQEYDGTRPGCGYYFRAITYAPFVIAVTWDISSGHFSTGASSIVLWFGKPVPLAPFRSWIT